jgi:hypothetical protein
MRKKKSIIEVKQDDETDQISTEILASAIVEISAAMKRISKSKLYMHGTVRSWIHYIELRTTPGTQKEHRDIAIECQNIFCEQFPTIGAALGWTTV